MVIGEFAQYLEKLESTSSRNEITAILAGVFRKSASSEIDKICYLALGRLAPKFRGVEFQLSSKSMVRVIARAYAVDEKEVTALFKKKGDLGIVAAECAASGKKTYKIERLSIKNVYDTLLSIAQEKGIGSVERKIRGFSDLLRTLDPLSARYVVRIPIGALRLGFSDMTILDALSWMECGDKSLRGVLEHAYNVSADIGRIAYLFKEKGSSGISHITVTTGIPIRPQQAERLKTAEEIVKKLGACAVEYKLDGFRAQVHVLRKNSKLKQPTEQIQIEETETGRDVMIFSRGLENTTHMFPEIVKEMAKLDVTDAILDGEAIGYEPKTGRHLPFQETIQRKRKHGISELARKIPLRYYAFDLLALNGKSFLSEPFKRRRACLEELFSRQKRRIDSQTLTIARQVVIDDPKELVKRFQESIKKGYEGIMAKKLTSSYQAGGRNFTWVKFKHVGRGMIADTLDCVVMGMYRGRGKRNKFGIGAFLVGVRNEIEGDIQYVTIAKIGTGLSDEQWKDMRQLCDNYAVKHKPEIYSAPSDLTPDVWVTPSIVVEVAADEITKTPIHTAGLALRFPRLISFRDDKSPRDATTSQEIETLYKMQSG